MLAPANTISQEITTAALLDTWVAHEEKALVLRYNGHDVQPSYVKFLAIMKKVSDSVPF
jgi:hypothetical protein